MTKTLNYYIGERINPQLPKPYYMALGLLTKKNANKYSKECLYGSISITEYQNKIDYDDAIAKLKENGFRVN